MFAANCILGRLSGTDKDFPDLAIEAIVASGIIN